ncbi:MAG: methyltransferase domain-containing protein [Opitutaceae bacterium]
MCSASVFNEVVEITSRLVAFSGPNGYRLVGYLDECAESSWNQRVVILAPRYGETKKNNLKLAYMLAANGFKVLRFDQTNHIGESDGTIDQFTLENGANDIQCAVDYVDRELDPTEVILLTSSLSTRCGLRACALDRRIARFVSLVGVVNMDRTLRSIYDRDFFGELAAGATWSKVDILGFEIEGARFHQSLLESNMLDLAGTIEDAQQISVPVLSLFAELDLWVDLEEVKLVMSKCRLGTVELLKNVGHEINENPKALNNAFSRLLDFCQTGLEIDRSVSYLPSKSVLLAQNKLERQGLQAVLKFSESEGEFWGDYLQKFGIIESADYYRDYFKTLANLLGAMQSYDVLLDAGCGNGFYGIGVMRALLQKVQSNAQFPKSVHYCGVDLTTSGLSRSYSRHVDELIQLQQQMLESDGVVGFSYRKIDFDTIGGESGGTLPFSNGSISKVCSSLVLSYLKEPILIMKEFYRVLKDGGVAVVSSMKPGCDMTVLYHTFMSQEDAEEDEQDATTLLSAAGRIKLKKDSGVYTFFEFEALEKLALEAGFTNIECVRSFGDQANLIRIVK